MAQSVNQQSVKLLVAFCLPAEKILLFTRLNEAILPATQIDFVPNESLFN